MENIDEILQLAPAEAVKKLKRKVFTPPAWSDLVKEYDPAQHPVTNKGKYPDKVTPDGHLEEVTRITLNYQQLATKRMSELVCGIPVKRIYSPEDDKQREASECLEAIFQRNRIDAVNIERCNALFSGCEILTLWYPTEEKNNLYGFASNYKIRCQTYSPREGAQLYPLFSEGDLIALSIETTRTEDGEDIRYLDTYTRDQHITYREGRGGWQVDKEEEIKLGKIPAIYCMRPTPIWEDTSRLVYEMEWALSRNGNYLRKNSKPIFAVFADEEVYFGGEESENKEYRAVVQYPKGSTAGYLTWSQAIDSLKFYIAELRQSFFTQLQLPDWSYESMKSTPMSGESRKQLFIDAQLKVTEESGRLLEFYDREVSVVKAYLAMLRPDLTDAIEALPVEVVITPYQITEQRDTITELLAANGNKPLISHRESIEQLGWSTNASDTLSEIQQESTLNAYEIAE